MQLFIWQRYDVLSQHPETRCEATEHYIQDILKVASCAAISICEFHSVQLFIKLREQKFFDIRLIISLKFKTFFRNLLDFNLLSFLIMEFLLSIEFMPIVLNDVLQALWWFSISDDKLFAIFRQLKIWLETCKLLVFRIERVVVFYAFYSVFLQNLL